MHRLALVATRGTRRELRIAGRRLRDHRREILRRQPRQRHPRASLQVRRVALRPRVAPQVFLRPRQVGRLERHRRMRHAGAITVRGRPIQQRIRRQRPANNRVHQQKATQEEAKIHRRFFCGALVGNLEEREAPLTRTANKLRSTDRPRIVAAFPGMSAAKSARRIAPTSTRAVSPSRRIMQTTVVNQSLPRLPSLEEGRSPPRRGSRFVFLRELPRPAHLPKSQ